MLVDVDVAFIVDLAYEDVKRSRKYSYSLLHIWFLLDLSQMANVIQTMQSVQPSRKANDSQTKVIFFVLFINPFLWRCFVFKLMGSDVTLTR